MPAFPVWVLALMVANVAFAADEPVFDLKVTKPADNLKVNKEGTVFVIQSKTGIGGAAISLTAGQWPKTVTFQFTYTDGKPFKALEAFKLSTDKFKVEGSLKDSGRMPYSVVNKDGKFEPKGTVDVQIKEGKEGIQVTLPASLLRDASKVELSWVDLFRQ
jgi:hypothetical protein